ncbi:MAG: ThuA domain-containing protein [Planctomycetota bacterium]
MRRTTTIALLAFFCCYPPRLLAAEKIRALVIDGQNKHHAWADTTPILHRVLEECGRFEVEVATSPPQGADLSGFSPNFLAYDVVVSNYDGEAWPATTNDAFEAFVNGGGGFVSVHAANNAFPGWPQYNRMIGLGGWRGRTESAGPYVYFREDRLIRDASPGPGGGHGEQFEFVVEAREPDHPILRGLPERWMHTKDELYQQLRGPAENMTILATAYAEPGIGGTGRDEPLLMVLEYGKGRVFHTTLGHATYSMRCVGFAETLCRGVEWAATGEVTLPAPERFPSESEPMPLPD